MQILALNDARESENRIHSDDVARRFGFNGALVSGVNVFGYLTQPLVRAYGARFLNQGIMDVVFIKPAYQDNLLSIRSETLNAESSQRNHLSYAYNEQEQLLARLETWLPPSLPQINPLARQEGPKQAPPRQEISWDAIQLQKTGQTFLWQPSAEDNQLRVAGQRDQSPVYQGDNGLIHPYYLLDACNQALMRLFILPAWIHTGSRLILRQALRVGQQIAVRCTPIAKWERKGHQLIKLYIVMWANDAVALEVEHSAIFRIAP